MKQKDLFLGLCLALLLIVRPVFSGYKVVNGPKDFYFGHISYSEIKNDGKDPLVFREGQTRPEVAILNLPLGPGDTIKTSDSRRCEVQFDNGTIVRLDLNTDLKIETILAQSLSTAKKLSNLLLAKGQIYVMYNKYNSLEIFQVITPGAAVKLDHNAVAFIKVTEGGNADVQVERGKVNLLYGPDKFHIYQTKIRQNQRFIASEDDQVRPEEYTVLSDFKSWNESINKDFAALHEASFLPKPIQKLPKAVFYFAQKFGNIYGEWVWHDLYGYVWRPNYNDYYPWGGWTPYYYGNWASYQNQLFWIPDEPWGWVPYHLGIWMWDKNKGWLWIPGSAFAPAWAVWDFYFGNYLWRPWTLFDWYYGPSYLSGYYYGGADYFYGLPGQRLLPGQNPANTIHSIRKDQLQKKETPSLPLPKEMKKAYKLTVAALKRGDESVLSSLQEIPRQAAIVKRSDLASPKMRERIISFEQFSKQREALQPSEKTSPAARPQDVSRDALRNIQRSRIISELKARSATPPNKQAERAPAALKDTHFVPGQVIPPSRPEASNSAGKVEKTYTPRPRQGIPPAQSSFRFRDWNPDVRTALSLGVEISYSSRTNEVSCPELGLSSRNVGGGIRLTGSGVSGGSGSGGSSSGVGSSSGTGSSSGGHPGTNSSGSSGSRGSEGGGGSKKN
jgi:hypothetical protein